MTRDEFMKKARGTVDQAFEHRKNGIMNLVEQAWAEGKHNADVETLRAAIEEALDRRQEAETIKNGSEFISWGDYLKHVGVLFEGWDDPGTVYYNGKYVIESLMEPIPPCIAERLSQCLERSE